MAEKIRAWAARPFNARLMPAAFYILFSMAFVTMLVTLRVQDCDTLYMVPQGREILSSGFPEYNSFTFFEGHKTIVQQWAYCVAVASIHDAAGLPGLIVFALAQALILFTLIRRRLSKYNGDGFWQYAAASLTTMVINVSYFISMRPENITLILLMLDIMIVDKYNETGKPRWLYLLPLTTLAEINIHASMWPFHFCILLARVFPNILRSALINTQMKPSWHLLPVTSLMAGSLFLNPYGFGNIAYVFRSMGTFQVIGIAEQQEVSMATMHGIVITALLMITAAALAKGWLSSTSAYVTAGFSLLAASAYHSTMFLTISSMFLACDLLKILSGKTGGRKLSDNLKNSIWVAMPLTAACFAIGMAQALGEENMTWYSHQDGSMGAAVQYIKDKGDEDANILNALDAGSYFEYYGLTNILCDTRPEMLSIKINGKTDALAVYNLMATGTVSGELGPDISSISDFLREYDIRYIVTYSSGNIWPALQEYLNENPDKYAPAKTAYDGERKPFMTLYERKETQDGD